VFGRRSKSEAVDAADLDAKIGGKGRPTPTRKEAEEARKQRLAAPKGRRGQTAQTREQAKAQRARMRSAMETGDDKYLPTRDKGPVKRYVRDYVDSRRTIGEFLLPVFFVVFIVILLAPQWAGLGSFAWLLIIALMVIDSLRISRGAKAGVRERFGDDETKGVTMYAVMRGWQMRRLRLPKPQVAHGDSI
jgi:hypothetical protein